MSRLWPVVRREYLERVRSKAFIIGTIAGPALIAGLMILPSLVMAKQRGKPLRIAVLDASGSLATPVSTALAAKRVEGEPRFVVAAAAPAAGVEEAGRKLKAAVLEGELDGYLYLPADALALSTAEYHGKNVSNVMDLGLLEEAVGEALVDQRLVAQGLDPTRVKDLTRHVEVKKIRVSAGGEREDRGATFLFSLVLLMMLYTSVILWGQALMTGVIEEKSNRVVEVIVSSVESTRLLGGKLLGVGAAGLTQLLVWAATMALLAAYGGSIFGFRDFHPPEITPLLVASFLAYFLLGYFLYAALYAAVGASVNSVQESQSLVFPIVMPLVLSIMFFGAVLGSPDSTLSIVLSLIPFFTPLLMFLRITVLTPPAWQIALSLVLTSLAIVLVTWIASRIYRVGILMYGKRPTFPEIIRWVRHA